MKKITLFVLISVLAVMATISCQQEPYPDEIKVSNFPAIPDGINVNNLPTQATFPAPATVEFTLNYDTNYSTNKKIYKQYSKSETDPYFNSISGNYGVAGVRAVSFDGIQSTVTWHR